MPVGGLAMAKGVAVAGRVAIAVGVAGAVSVFGVLAHQAQSGHQGEAGTSKAEKDKVRIHVRTPSGATPRASLSTQIRSGYRVRRDQATSYIVCSSLQLIPIIDVIIGVGSCEFFPIR